MSSIFETALSPPDAARGQTLLSHACLSPLPPYQRRPGVGQDRDRTEVQHASANLLLISCPDERADGREVVTTNLGES